MSYRCFGHHGFHGRGFGYGCDCCCCYPYSPSYYGGYGHCGLGHYPFFHGRHHDYWPYCETRRALFAVGAILGNRFYY